MSPEAQRIAIAEACGYKPYPWFTGEFLMKQGNLGPPFWSKDGKDAYVPDYLNDLNATIEAEKVITDIRICEKFVLNLLSIIKSGHLFGDTGLCELCVWYCLQATAAQRAEAFLRTIGKWKEAQPVPLAN